MSMFSFRTSVLALGLFVTTVAAFAGTDDCERVSGKTQCVVIRNSLGEAFNRTLSFDNGTILHAGTSVGSYVCKGYGLFSASLLLGPEAAVSLHGRASARGNRLTAYGEMSGNELVFSVVGHPCP